MDRRDATILLAGLIAGQLVLPGLYRAYAQDRRQAKPKAPPHRTSDATDALVLEHMRKHSVPGLSLAVLRDGAILKTAGYGVMNIETRTKCDSDTVYNIGSVSKQFLATAIMILVQEGKLNLEDRAAKFLGDAPESWRGLTLRHLLSHTGGLVRNPPAYDRKSAISASENIRRSYATALMFPPGTDFSYSNLGYFILGEVLEKASKQPWADFLRVRIFKPAGLEATGIGEIADAGKATGYVFRNGDQKVAEGYSVPRPSGGVHSTVLDLLKWDKVLNGDLILKKAARDLMWTPVRLANGRAISYGLGWRLRKNAKLRTISHSGHVPGFGAIFIRQPEAKFTLAILANADAPQAKLNVLASDVQGVLRDGAGKSDLAPLEYDLE